MHRSELIYWLALLRYPGIGPVKFSQIIEEAACVEELWINGELSSYIKNKYHLNKAKTNWQLLEEDLLWRAKKNNYIITLKDKEYPPLLRQIYAPPPILFATGNIAVLSNKALAMVGSRQASQDGLLHAFNFAQELALSGFNVISGLAVGIDAACHRGAILSTTAVLPSGINCIYPPQHADLAEKIQDKGLLLSEFPLHTKSIASNFVRRNRIISGLSLGVVIIEAKIKSGSMVTAKYAIEQNREVFVLPWNIANEAYSGNHLLIQYGAKLVVNTQQIMEDL